MWLLRSSLMAKLLVVSLMAMLVIGLPWTRQSPLQTVGVLSGTVLVYSADRRSQECCVLCSSRTFSPAPMLVVGLPAAAAAAPAGGYMSPSDAATAIKTAATQNTGTAWGFFVYSVATDFSNSANGVPYSAQVRALLS